MKNLCPFFRFVFKVVVVTDPKLSIFKLKFEVDSKLLGLDFDDVKGFVGVIGYLGVCPSGWLLCIAFYEIFDFNNFKSFFSKTL